MRFSMITLGGLMLAAATPAMAQDETEPADDPVSISGSVSGVSDYRFRGVSQTGEDAAVQAGVTVTHESGFYASVWTSTIKDDKAPVIAGYGDAEVDLSAGYGKTFDNGVGVDVGLLYYLYPIDKAGFDTDFFEPYASVSYTVGPVSAKVGANYAWSGQSGLAGNDSLYLRGDVSVALPGTPVAVLGHVGHTDGQLGFFAPGSKYWDWSLGAEVTQGFAKLGVQYVDTDIPGGTLFGTPDYANVWGADPTVLFYLTLSF